MPIFSKLFGSSQERELKKRLTEIEKKVKKEYKPMGEIGKAIVLASTNSRDAVKDLISASTEIERQERDLNMFCEFIYFYVHMTMRHASVQLTESQVGKLQNYLGPLLSSVAIESYCGHWPDDLKEIITREFYDKLNQAESEYAKCTQFDSTDQGEERFTRKLQALFVKLGRNIASLVTDEVDLAIVMSIAKVAINEWSRMEFDNLIAEVKKANYSGFHLSEKT